MKQIAHVSLISEVSVPIDLNKPELGDKQAWNLSAELVQVHAWGIELQSARADKRKLLLPWHKIHKVEVVST